MPDKLNINKPTIEDVKSFWEKHPLYSYELKELETEKFFEKIDFIKREDVEKFSFDLWEFDKFKNKKVLDVGCGPGWYTVQYCLGGAQVYAIDISSSAVEICKKHLKYKNLVADVRVGNAEALPFEDETFSLVVSPGVLHHTPNQIKAFKEIYRVLIPGGKAKISLYHKGFLHSKAVFPFVKLAIKLFKIRHPGSEFFRTVSNADDFIRQYDGFENPLGIGKTTKEWANTISETGFKIVRYKLYYFPKRFMPFSSLFPYFLHKFLDRTIGTLIFFDLTK